MSVDFDELELLRAWEPEPRAADEAGAARRARARLDAHIHAARPRRRQWIFLAPPALAVAAAGIVVLVLTLGSGVQEGHLAPPPANALEAAARAAERQPVAEAFPRPDQFFYTKSLAMWSDCWLDAPGGQICKLVTRRRETWLSERHRGLLREQVLRDRFASPGDRTRWIAAGRPRMDGGALPSSTGLGRERYYLGNEPMTYAELLAYRPTGREVFERLRDHWVRGQGGSLYGEVFTQIGDALREQASPPALRAALYRALTFVPGVRITGPVKDAIGRPAMVAGRSAHGVRSELLFDPRTSVLLGERDIAPGGTIAGYAIYERQAVVDEAGRRP
jgi:hypothetical protein